MPESTIPSIDAAVASSSSELNNPVIPAELQVHIKKDAEPAAKQEPTSEQAKDEPAKVTGLADGLAGLEAEPEAKPEPAPDEQREGEKPAAYIKRLKAERDEARNQAKQFQETAAKKAAASPEEITALREEIAKRDAILEEKAFERTEKFQNNHVKPIEKAVAAAKDVISKFTETKGVYERALALDGRERMDFLREHLDDAAATAFDRISRVEELTADRDAALANRAEVSKTLAAEREQNENAAVLSAFDAQRETIAKQLSVFRGDDADALVAQARSLIDGTADPKDVLAAAYLAVAAPRYIAQLKAAQAELAVFKARDAERESGKPKIAARGAENGSASVMKDGKLPTIDDIMRQARAA